MSCREPLPDSAHPVVHPFGRPRKWTAWSSAHLALSQFCAGAVSAEDAPSLLASGGKDGSCRLWDIRQRDRSPVVEEREAHSKPIASICVWGDRLMTASAGGFCAIWDLRSVDRSLRQPLCEFDIFGRSLTKKRKHAGGLSWGFRPGVPLSV